MSLADAVDPLPFRIDALPSPHFIVVSDDDDSMVYLNSWSLLPPPVARPSEALRKRKRSLSRHFLLPLPQPRIMDVLGDGGEDGNSPSSSPAPAPTPLNGERDRVALLLLDDAVETGAGRLDLPLSDDGSAVWSPARRAPARLGERGPVV
uniref:Uncharacterized protein n=1 Tax=Arundo donax TaxID=35708 RepID=A0A0A9A8B2_ARUDO